MSDKSLSFGVASERGMLGRLQSILDTDSPPLHDVPLLTGASSAADAPQGSRGPPFSLWPSSRPTHLPQAERVRAEAQGAEVVPASVSTLFCSVCYILLLLRLSPWKTMS